ncbi:MAG: RNA 3'-terminal phosphate cyclase [Gemmataceae bacterium]
MGDTIELDGGAGEGGGQILRSALTLSLLTGRPFHLRHVRANRPKPGLQPQHLMSVKAAERVGSAHTRGASAGSSDLVFEPGPVSAGTYRFDIGTAGATGLVLQTVYLPLALRGAAASEVTITGGTHVRTSPAYPFLDGTWRPLLARAGLDVRLDLFRPGFYPRGGGMIGAVLPACPGLRGVRLLERSATTNVTVVAAVAGLDAGIARRMARRLTHRLERLGLGVAASEETWEGGPGCVVYARLDADPAPVTVVAAGERGKPAEAVADQAFDEMAAYLKGDAPIDAHSGDQLLLPLALASGPSEYRVVEVTRHLTTNAAVIRRFLDREIAVDGDEGGPGVVRVGA